MAIIRLGQNVTKVHFIGVGGISMSGLAEILMADGYQVSGSDEADTPILTRLRASGAQIYVGNKPENIAGDVNYVVYTAAVKADNPELMAAQERGLPIIDRAGLLNLIMAEYDKTVCVAGTHGKTTATSFVSDIFLSAGLNPTIQIGGHMGEGAGFNFRLGQSQYFVMEACEYANSFLQWSPYVGVVLNIDNDHMEFFGSMEHLIESFAAYAGHIRAGGTLVINAQTVGLDKIAAALGADRAVITFGEGGRFTAAGIVYDGKGHPAFTIMDGDEIFCHTHICLPGEYNIQNALAACAAAYALGLTPAQIAQGLASARGVKRRFEIKGEFNGATIVDDYAHHPTAIRKCLAAAKAGHLSRGETNITNGGSAGRIICVFQPHNFSRTRHLFTEFGQSFDAVDKLILLPIYTSREKTDENISSKILSEEITRNGVETLYVDTFADAENYLREELMPGDLLITMGAGEAYMVGDALLRT